MRSNTAVSALIIASVFALLLCAAKPVEKPQPPDDQVFGGVWDYSGAVKVPANERVFHHESTGSYESEGNFYMSRFNDGWILMTHIFVWKYLSMKGYGIYALVISPQGKRYFAKQQLNEKKVVLAKDHLFVQEGANSVEEKNGEYRVKFNIENFSCDLTYRSNVPMLRPGDGYAWFSKKDNIYAYSLLNCPWADVTGWIKLPDRTLQVKGEGYSDKGRGTMMPTKMAPYLYSIRVFSPVGTPKEDRWMLGILEQQMPASYGSKRIPTLHLCNNDKTVLATKIYDLEPSDWRPGKDSPYDYPRRFKIRAKDNGWAVEGDYVCGELFDFLDVLAELPGWIKTMAVKFVKRPVFFRSNGVFDGTVTAPDGKKTKIHLVGPHEYVVTK